MLILRHVQCLDTSGRKAWSWSGRTVDRRAQCRVYVVIIERREIQRSSGGGVGTVALRACTVRGRRRYREQLRGGEPIVIHWFIYHYYECSYITYQYSPDHQPLIMTSPTNLSARLGMILLISVMMIAPIQSYCKLRCKSEFVEDCEICHTVHVRDCTIQMKSVLVPVKIRKCSPPKLTSFDGLECVNGSRTRCKVR